MKCNEIIQINTQMSLLTQNSQIKWYGTPVLVIIYLSSLELEYRYSYLITLLNS